MSKNNQDKFNFFVPAEISKAKDGLDEGRWNIEGVCSTTDKDSDGENLEPAGYDFSPLLQKGYINWNHQANKSSGAIIGRPTDAAIVQNGQAFHIKGFLYKGLDEAKNVYNLINTLKQEDPERQLGWSIEGQAIERDPLNPKRITKARITGVALTHASKCPNTFASIVKGEYSEAFVADSDDSADQATLNLWAAEYKDWTSNTEDNYGNEGDVLEFLQNNHEDDQKILKPLCDVIMKNKEMEKAMTAAAGEGTTSMESVDGGQEKLKQTFLKKSEVYDLIFSKSNTQDINLIKSIYNLAQEVSKTVFNMEEITPEAIEKAFDLLKDSSSLIKAEDADKKMPPMKEDASSEEDDDKEDVEKACSMINDYLKKGFTQEEAVEVCCENYPLSVVDKAIAKIIDDLEGDQNGEVADGNHQAAMPGDAKDGLTVAIAKSEESEEIKKPEEGEAEKPAVIEKSEKTLNSEELITSIQQTINSSQEITKAELASFEDRIVQTLNSKFQNVATILKGVYEGKEIEKSQREELLRQNSELVKRLEVVEKQPVGLKSIVKAQAVERFDKSEQNSDPASTYSLSNSIEKGALLDNLVTKAMQGGPLAGAFEKAIAQIEGTGGIDDASALDAIKRSGITVRA